MGQDSRAETTDTAHNSDPDIYARAVRPGSLQTTAVTYTYDLLYRLTGATYTGAISATYEYAYDAVGNRLTYTATVSSTDVITYGYDAANRLLESVVQGGDTTTYQWDDAGRARPAANSLCRA